MQPYFERGKNIVWSREVGIVQNESVSQGYWTVRLKYWFMLTTVEYGVVSTCQNVNCNFRNVNIMVHLHAGVYESGWEKTRSLLQNIISESFLAQRQDEVLRLKGKVRLKAVYVISEILIQKYETKLENVLTSVSQREC